MSINTDDPYDEPTEQELGWKEELEHRVAQLEEELGRRYRELESQKARSAELERELDYAYEENRAWRQTIDRLNGEIDEVRTRLYQAERRADEAEQAQKGYGW